MNLTGKCKEDFEKWLINEPDIERIFKEDGTEIYFDDFSPSMQCGVYEDFFGSVGVQIEVQFYDEDAFMSFIYFGGDSNPLDKYRTPMLKTRTEARAKAIEKANEIYNQ